jgi:hypothetical protein
MLPVVVGPLDPAWTLHEDNLLIEARVPRIPSRKDLLRGHIDSCKTDDDGRPPVFFGEEVAFDQQAMPTNSTLSKFSAPFTILVPYD